VLYYFIVKAIKNSSHWRKQKLTEEKMKIEREYPHMHQNLIRLAFEPIY
jgi:hypothetical protein